MSYNAVEDDSDITEVAVVSTTEKDGLSEDEIMSEKVANTDSAAVVALMKQKSFPNIEDVEPLEDGFFTWEISDWKGLGANKLFGPTFQLAGFNWRVLLFPEGNNSQEVSVYLEASPLEPPQPKGDQGIATLTPDTTPEASVQLQSDAKSEMDIDAPFKETDVGAQIDDDEGDDDDLEHYEDDDSNDWAVCAQFGLVMWNPDDPTVYHHSGSQHRFTPDETDWGFTRFFELRKLFATQPGKSAPLIQNNKVNITAYVRVMKDPTGVLWHNFLKYNSKKATGYVGLKNQGATCYLNSLLQSLYFTKAFRQAVYKIPTETDGADTVSTALQTLFYLLNSSTNPVGTLVLTKSFGWDSADAFTQHDVQELNRVLMDKLETRMKGTDIENALNNLFVGQMKSFVKCVNVDFESSRIEDYWDIQLNVKGMKNVEESFRDYVQVELLEGENQYHATGLGLQDANKGVVFESFPAVLHLQLKRYEYDFVRDMMVKINDRYEFPLEMDLTPYLDPSAPNRDENWEYELHGVLVHSGDLNVGHYYALIKPEKDGNWFKFDDDRVTQATLKEVLEENFGGELYPSVNSGAQVPARNTQRLYKRHSSAYMLVYIRKTKLDTVLFSGKDEIPSHIPKRIAQEAHEEKMRRKVKEEQHFFLNVQVMTNKQFKCYHGTDLGEWDTEITPEEGAPKFFSFRKAATVAQLALFLQEEIGIKNSNDMRIWTMIPRQNRTLRLNERLDNNDNTTTIEQVKNETLARNGYRELRLWVEDSSETLVDKSAHNHRHGHHFTDLLNGKHESDREGGDDQRILLFLKYFDPEKQLITGVTTAVVSPDDKASKLVKLINRYMDWPENTALRFNEEVKPNLIEELKLKNTFRESEIVDGDIICFERVLPSEGINQPFEYSTAIEYYDFLLWRVLVTFRPKPEDDEIPYFNSPSGNEEDENGTPGESGEKAVNDNKPVFEIWLSRKDGYEKVAQKVAAKLGSDTDHLQLYVANTENYSVVPLKHGGGGTLQQWISSGYVSRATLFYEVMNMSLSELESKKVLTISWLTEGLSQEHKHKVIVPKTGAISDVLQILKTQVGIKDDEQLSHVKVWCAYSSRLLRTFDATSPVEPIMDSASIYATIMPDDEYQFLHNKSPTGEEKLINVVHFQQDSSRTHGIPFSFVVKRGEPFGETKQRLQKVLGIYDKMFEKIKFAVFPLDSYAVPSYINEANEGAEDSEERDKIDLFELIEDNECLGLDHVDRTARRIDNHQTAIFIKS